ncbi:MAG: DinB family protein [Phycisphaerae bacterium]
MSLIDPLLHTMNHSHSQLLKLVADLSDDQLAFQPAPKTNHPAWVLGHQIQVDHSFLSLITGQPAPAGIDANWKTIYGNKSEPVSDKSKYKPKAFYLEKLAAVREQIIARLKQMKPEDFAAPHPDPARRERFPTVGHMVMLYATWHEAYHAGQLSTWRRVQGLPPV